MISNSYLSENFAGLFTTLTPRSETTDMLPILRERERGRGSKMEAQASGSRFSQP